MRIVPKITEIIFILTTFASVYLVYMVSFKPGSFLISEHLIYPLIPHYVIIYSIIGGLMYLFASTSFEWREKKEELKGDGSNLTALNAFNDKPFFDKLKSLGFERKGFRVMAAPLLAIGIYLLFDMIFFDLASTAEQTNLSTNLTNATLQEVVTAIENANDDEKIILIKSGISFLAGAFVKQFLDLIQALADRMAKNEK